MKRILLTAYLATRTLFSLNAQTVTYTTTLDDPNGIRAIQIHLVPFYMNLSRAAVLDMGGELWATADLSKKFRLMTSWRGAYYQIDKPADVSNLIATKSEIPHTSSNLGLSRKFEAIAQFNFANYTRNRNVKIILEQYATGYGNYPTSQTKYIMVPGTVRKSFGIRGGVYHIYSPINLSETEGENGQPAFYAVNTSGPSDTLQFGGQSNGAYTSYPNVYTSFNSLVLAAGIDMRTVTNLVIDTDSHGSKSNRQSSNLYIDALIALSGNYRELYKSDMVYSVIPFRKFPIGWRLGWQIANPVRTWISMKFEVGQRPEWRSQNLSGAFMDFNLGLNIPVRVKKIAD